MNKAEAIIIIKYFATSTLAFVFYLFGKFLKNTALYGTEYANQIIMLLPYFALCITIPFFIAGIERLILHAKYEMRIFYYMISASFLFLCFFITKVQGTSFAAFKIISGTAGLCMDVFLHTIINLPLDKANKSIW